MALTCLHELSLSEQAVPSPSVHVWTSQLCWKQSAHLWVHFARVLDLRNNRCICSYTARVLIFRSKQCVRRHSSLELLQAQAIGSFLSAHFARVLGPRKLIDASVRTLLTRPWLLNQRAHVVHAFRTSSQGAVPSPSC